MTKTLSPEQYLAASAIVERIGNVARFAVDSANLEVTLTSLLLEHGLPLKTVVATDDRASDGTFRITYIVGVPGADFFLAPYLMLPKGVEHFPSLAIKFQEMTYYEREIHSFFGLVPDGHPDLRPLNLHENWPTGSFPLRKDFAWNHRPRIANTPYKFQQVEGEGIYEIPVGPVHAGIIEPGHFRFSMAGEEIVALEPRLGFVHKGSEKLFETLPLADTLKLSERISGDSSFHHSLAYCQALEVISQTDVSPQAQYLRVIFAELERLANHCGDLGGIMIDTGFSFGGSHGGRLRERILQWNDRITGSRYLRGVNAIGGVTVGIEPEIIAELARDLRNFERDLHEVIGIALDTSSLLNRLKGTGTLDPVIARDHGVIGVAARALGSQCDARLDFPYAAYGKLPVKLSTATTGDVYARFLVRVKEAKHSLELIQEALEKLSTARGLLQAPIKALKKNAFAVGVVEGWRGDIVYFVATDAKGNLARVKVRDTSFLNWSIFPYVALNDVIPDFPLINKSFSLSYSGNDL